MHNIFDLTFHQGSHYPILKEQSHMKKIAYSLLLGSALAFNAQAADQSSSLDLQNKQQGDQFMEQNKNKKGTVTLPSGLQYEVITNGSGKKPSKNDVVTVEYEGRLLNGHVF